MLNLGAVGRTWRQSGIDRLWYSKHSQSGSVISRHGSAARRRHAFGPHRQMRGGEARCLAVIQRLVETIILGPISNFVREVGFEHQATNLSPNRMANWVLASHHSRDGRFHASIARLRTRYRSFNTLAETINGLYKAEVIHRRGPWCQRRLKSDPLSGWVQVET